MDKDCNLSKQIVFAYSVGCQKHSFLMRYCKQMMQESPRSDPCVFGSNTLYACFQFVRIWFEKSTIIHDVNVLWFLNYYHWNCQLLIVNMLAKQRLCYRLNFLKVQYKDFRRTAGEPVPRQTIPSLLVGCDEVVSAGVLNYLQPS